MLERVIKINSFRDKELMFAFPRRARVAGTPNTRQSRCDRSPKPRPLKSKIQNESPLAQAPTPQSEAHTPDTAFLKSRIPRLRGPKLSWR